MRTITTVSCAFVTFILSAPDAQAECIGDHCYDGLERAFAIGFYGVIGVIALIFAYLRWWKTAGALVVAMAFWAFGMPLWYQVSSDQAMERLQAREVWTIGTDPFQGTPVLLSPLGEYNCEFSVCSSIVKAAGDNGILSFSFAAIKALDPARSTNLASLPLERWVSVPGGFVATPLTAAETADLAPQINRLIVVGAVGDLSRPEITETLFSRNPALEGLPEDQVIRFASAPLDEPGFLNPSEMKFDILDLYLVGKTVPAPLWIRGSQKLENPLSEQAETVIRTAICSGRAPSTEDKCLEPFR